MMSSFLLYSLLDNCLNRLFWWSDEINNPISYRKVMNSSLYGSRVVIVWYRGNSCWFRYLYCSYGKDGNFDSEYGEIISDDGERLVEYFKGQHGKESGDRIAYVGDRVGHMPPWGML